MRSIKVPHVLSASLTKTVMYAKCETFIPLQTMISQSMEIPWYIHFITKQTIINALICLTVLYNKQLFKVVPSCWLVFCVTPSSEETE